MITEKEERMIAITQSITDFPQGGKSLETRLREQRTRVVKRKPLKFKTVYRNIKLQGKKRQKRVKCYVNQMKPFFVVDEAHKMLSTSAKFLLDEFGARLSTPRTTID